MTPFCLERSKSKKAADVSYLFALFNRLPELPKPKLHGSLRITEQNYLTEQYRVCSFPVRRQRKNIPIVPLGL